MIAQRHQFSSTSVKMPAHLAQPVAVIRVVDKGTAFGPVEGDVRIFLVQKAHLVRCTRVAVPCHTVDILAQLLDPGAAMPPVRKNCSYDQAARSGSADAARAAADLNDRG